MKNTKMFWAVVSMTVVFCWLVSCQKEEMQTKETQDVELQEPDTARMIKIGEKLENPYSVENMRRAYDRLLKKNKVSKKTYAAKTFKDSNDISTTDYYVRFWVENDEQKSLLLADSLNLSVVPLDVEIVEDGDHYLDEGSELDGARWLYTSVVENYHFHESIKYEKLEDLFLIEASDLGEEEEHEEMKTTTIGGKTGISKNFLYDLEDEALMLTGNLDAEQSRNGAAVARSRQRPQGHVRVLNTVSGNFDPVVGVKVKTRKWFKWAKGWTNAEGFYRVNRRYRRNVRYTVIFKNNRGFKIWPSVVSVSAARFRAGSRSKFGHDFNFRTNSAGWRWATVNNATRRYLDYCTQFGIGRPHRNLRIVALGGSGASSAPMLRRVWGLYGFTTRSKVVTFLAKANKLNMSANVVAHMLKFIQPDLIIRANANRGTDGVFSVTFHELAHASHFKKVGSRYWIKYINYIISYGTLSKAKRPYGDGRGKNFGLCALGEAWAYHCGYTLILEEFGNDNNIVSEEGLENFEPIRRPSNISINRQGRPLFAWEGWIPSGIMNDLEDDNEDLIRQGFNDNVSGYGIADIFNALDSGIESPQAFRNRLLSENGNRAANDVRNLFEAYHWD
ncbi:hypothetical protein M3P19_08495 [Muricauda sp. 2012CJ35-5]|uniref:Uncharacterized protein n=1 Tax=Flagellimonas spongiicola TaxID=2942208 RepID=A0ABT0PSV6_9FLAO|nr:hypothetical protein [Allomuricauda spongiicola]MCL6274046.1 hypothetical protein [Allomuricauda spongiicola]